MPLASSSGKKEISAPSILPTSFLTSLFIGAVTLLSGEEGATVTISVEAFP